MAVLCVSDDMLKRLAVFDHGHQISIFSQYHDVYCCNGVESSYFGVAFVHLLGKKQDININPFSAGIDLI